MIGADNKIKIISPLGIYHSPNLIENDKVAEKKIKKASNATNNNFFKFCDNGKSLSINAKLPL